MESRRLNVGSVGIIYLRSSEVQTYQEQGPPRGLVGQWEAVRPDIGLLYGLLSAQGAHKLVSHDGKRPVDFFFEQDLDSGNLPCSSLLLPNPYLLSLKQHENLKRWVKTGGTLITEARYGQKDENGHLYPAPLLEDFIGQTVEYSEIISDGFHDVIEGHIKGYQLIEKKLGRGKVVYANFSLFLLAKKGESQWPNTDILIKKIKSIL